MEEQAYRIKGMSELDDTKISYWKVLYGEESSPSSDNIWILYIPGCGAGALSNHYVEEHEDGTITVTPSILMTGHNKGMPTMRHGYITKGTWREV